MEYALSFVGVVIAVLTLISAYHIAAKQGIFHKHEILLTLSKPVLANKGDKIPRYTEVRKIGNLKYPESYPDKFYPFMLRMPLMVTFGTTETTKINAFFLLMTIINNKSKPVENVTINIYLPDHLMPDNHMPMGKPNGTEVKRNIDKATGQGEIQYDLSLKPYDCLIIPELIIIDQANIITEIQDTDAEESKNSRISTIRCIMRTSDIVYEERLYVAAIEASNIIDLCEKTITLGGSLIDKHIKSLKKPLIHRLFRLPFGSRTLLCVKPSLMSPVDGVALHMYGQEDDRSEAEILGIVKK
ncbi:MAG: hypothetical protein HYV59_06115 [Planctomycetes bacterium]|nr:hypothetical protein [Planctomycetota bacterium]